MRIPFIVLLTIIHQAALAQFVGIGTKEPLYSLHTAGQLVVQAPYRKALGNTFATHTMINGGSPNLNDSMIRFFDPGGSSGAYLSGLSAQFSLVTPSSQIPEIGYEFEIEQLDLGTGDTLRVLQVPRFDQVSVLSITKDNSVGQRFILNVSNSTIIRFTSNVDGIQGAGFSILMRKVYATNPPAELNWQQLPGNVLAFDVNKGSFLAGKAANNGVSGNYSVSLGLENEVAGESSVGIGDNNRSQGVQSSIVGSNNIVLNDRSGAFGIFNLVQGGNSFAFGVTNSTNTNLGIAVGISNTTTQQNQIMLGRSLVGKTPNSVYLGFDNDTASLNPIVSNQSWPSTEPLLVIGNGSSSTSSNALVMHKDGNTGIGINRPQARLHVRDKVVIEQPGTTGLASFEWRSNNTYRGGFGYDAGAARFFFFDGESGTNTFFVNNGRFGIQRDATTNALEVNGNASKSSAGDWLANSDARLKKDILPLQRPLEKIQQLQGITFAWNDTKTGIDRPSGNQMGFTAQNVQQVFPELVSTDAQGYLQTSYGTYDALYVEAIKALHEQNKILQQQVEQLQQQIHAIQQKIK